MEGYASAEILFFSNQQCSVGVHTRVSPVTWIWQRLNVRTWHSVLKEPQTPVFTILNCGADVAGYWNPAQISHSLSLSPPPPPFSCWPPSLSHTYIYTLQRTHPPTHAAYTTHLHTKCKQRVIDRSLHPASSVCVLIPSAGPAPPVHSVRDELLHGSSFFLPGPSPLWPSGRNGKTSLVNYLRVKAASATCHAAGQECEGMSVCVSSSATW